VVERRQNYSFNLVTRLITGDVNLITETAYGNRYQISANLITPIDRPLLVKTVWQIDINTDLPRLITLVPD
jgi:hypothetical protein